jgi:NDP-sugar pyrophosphorylase family protein
MKIIIPMSGAGQRFVDAGYKVPKPLIEMDGIPIIEHVVRLFPGETDFIFICNSTHLKETNMRAVLERIAPKGKIVEIAPHKKGPVYAASLVFDQIHDDEEVIVNYCDFGTYWDYPGFLQHTRNRKADGAIPSYKGFHPHMLGTTNYAFLRDENQWMLEIQEKKPFTDNRMQEYASNGTYYFRTAAIMKKYFHELMALDQNLNGEFYVSMVYNLLVRDHLKVSIFEIQHMLQWGTPRDVEEYNKWSDYFRHIISPEKKLPVPANSKLLIPLAGRGNRFVTEGYKDPKPLVEVSGKAMIIQAADYLPACETQTFICLKDHLQQYPLEAAIKKGYPQAKILSLDKVTEGQACTCELGLEGEDENTALLIGVCDNGVLFNKEKYQALLDDTSVDAIVWSFRHHPSSEQNPQMYGWIKTDGGDNVTGVSVKVPISQDPYNDHAIVGMFYFRKAKYFLDALQNMYQQNTRVNNEFYVDSCVNELVAAGLKVKVFEVDDYICWGTPNDYRTFVYWQSFFHKCDWHPYSLEKDPTMEPSKISDYKKTYTEFEQKSK